MKRHLALLFFVLHLSALPAFASAGSERLNEEDVSLIDAIRRLDASVQTLERLMLDQSMALEQQLAVNRLNTAIAYLNFRSRKIEMLERDLEHSRGNLERFEDFLMQLSQREEQLEDEARTESGETLQAIEQAKEEVAGRKKLITMRKERLDSEILDLEIKIADLQNQIDSVEAFVQENLDM